VTRILVVDDSPLMRGLVRSTVEIHGRGRTFRITEAENGEQALTFVRQGAVDLILLDWNMPKLDGIGLVKRLRGDGIDIPIVMVTSVDDDQSMHAAVRAGVTDYVLKPFKTSDLWERIRGFIGR
jgi:CheY-like chemotaxis protein